MLNVGVIGCGAIGREHIARLSGVISGTKVVAVSDVFEESAQQAAALCNAKVYKTGAELIADPQVDAVVVTSPGFAHAESVLQAVQAGKKVFCEKPLATTAAQCREIVEAEMAAGQHLVQVGFMRRYDSGYRQVKEVIDARELGAPLLVHCTHRNPDVAADYSTEMAVHDTAIHEIDCLHWLIDDEYESVQVMMPKITSNAHEGLQDPQLMLLRTKGGICISLEVFVSCQFGYDINCEVVCETGTVKLPSLPTPIIRKEGRVSEGIEMNWKNRFIAAYDVELQDWADHAQKGMVKGPTAWDGYIASVTADALVKSQKTGAIEPVVMEPIPDFYK
ncbi:MAG: Gfo/Idh/MocA family protein [Lachnospiraceae bacterium]